MKRIVFLDRHWKTTLLLGVGFIAIVGFNLLLSQMEIDTSPLPVDLSQDEAATKKVEGGPRSLLGDLDLPETLARPLFSPTRQDFVAPPATPAEPVVMASLAPPVEPATSLPPIRLEGTRAVNGKYSALIAVGEASSNWLNEGDKIDGWTILSVTHNGLVLMSGAESASISLYQNEKAPQGDTSN